jgi:hypothetical protein
MKILNGSCQFNFKLLFTLAEPIKHSKRGHEDREFYASPVLQILRRSIISHALIICQSVR